MSIELPSPPPGIVVVGVACGGGAVVAVGIGVVAGGVATIVVALGVGNGFGVDDGFGVGVVICLAITICGVAAGNWSAFTLLESSTDGGVDERPCCEPQALNRTIASKLSAIYTFLPTTVQILLCITHYKMRDS